MSTPLQEAMELLASALGGSPSVRRVELDPRGSLVLCIDTPDGPEWLRCEEHRLIPVVVDDDDRLPLAAVMADVPADRPAVLAYRPGRRLVLRHRSPVGSRIEKGYRPRKWRAARSRHESALGALSDPTVDFVIPRLVRFEPSRASLEFDHLRGEPLRIESSEADRFFAIGAALRSFQRAPVPGRLKDFGPAEELRVIDQWADRARRVAGWQPMDWSTLRSEAHEVALSLSAARTGFAHRDLHDGQLLDTGAGVALLDFDLLCRADNCLDPANLLVHLTLRTLQRRPGASEADALACGSALLEGLDRNRERGFWPRLRFYEMTSFLRLAFVYSLRPCWPGLSESLVECGRRCLAEVGR